MTTIYLSLGSNMGDKQDVIEQALARLKEHMMLQKISSFYHSEPWGNRDQPDFLNICAEAETSLGPEELLSLMKSIEADLGRTTGERWGPREIDIDILFYGDKLISLPGLRIPHPHLVERAFVLVPLAEIAPEFRHPGLNKTIAELAAKIGSEGIVKVER